MLPKDLCLSATGTTNKVLGNLVGSSISVEIAAIKANTDKPLTVICTDSLDATRLRNELKFLCPKEDIYIFNDYETLPYDMLSPHQEIISSRLEFLSKAEEISSGIIITTLRAVMQRLSPRDYILQHSFVISIGEQRDLQSLRASFLDRGYLQVEQVLAHGEFSIRGSIMDVFPMGSRNPLRVDFLDDEVDSIAYFDIATQRSTQKIDSVKLLPAQEFPLTSESITHFRESYREAFKSNNLRNHIIYQAISSSSIPAGIEYYLPLFFDKTATFFDYISKDMVFVLNGDFEEATKQFDLEVESRVHLFLGNADHPPLTPERVFLNSEEVLNNLKGKERITLMERPLIPAELSKRGFNNAPFHAVPEISFNSRDRQSAANPLMNFLARFTKRKGRVLITAQSEGRRQSLRDLIPAKLVSEYGIEPASNFEEFLKSDAKVMMTIAPFDVGFVLDGSEELDKDYLEKALKKVLVAKSMHELNLQAQQEAHFNPDGEPMVEDSWSLDESEVEEFAHAANDAKKKSAAKKSTKAKSSKASKNKEASESEFPVVLEELGANEFLDDNIDESAGFTVKTNEHSDFKSAHNSLVSEAEEIENLINIQAKDHAKNYKDKFVKAKIEFPIAILTETEILGFRVVRQRRQNQKKDALFQETMVRNLAQLTEGQIVVHIDHGIGRYKGLKTETINGVKCELITIEYAEGDILSIPITALNKIAKFAGDNAPPLSRLGHDAWSKKKLKAVTKVRDVAVELLDLYAQRQLKKGFAFKVDEIALAEFAQSFPYQETVDQMKAIEQTLEDMQKPIAMDRLVCGDVGFGKTEVAIRAAFVAAMNGKQVAILAPTTILAEQHYQNFKERFATTAINVDLISRFRSSHEQSETIKKIRTGEVDIVIGTHRLLYNSIAFKDLGLLIIDEEHRFGVRQKERLKALRAEVDLLTLTATPIPRTLNMALEGLRSLSIIATPPEHRLAVKTFLHENSDTLCREAILRELRRGGQVYYLHNDVASMKVRLNQLEKLVPEAKIEIANGQMHEDDLQRVMRDFCHHRFNVLLCSTIVENGLDIPSANTIIIDRADLLGLAQLHQIRGRVGRSHHQAYAYMFTPPKSALTTDAVRRLEAVTRIDALGAGFALASQDLEIRGAGEILGEDQSGQISAVGFTLYMDMLNAAVQALKSGREPTLSELTLNECSIDMHLPALFQDNYISSVSTRLSTYKRLSMCETDEQFDDLRIELIDRFGFLPEESENLFKISKLKRLATSLGITKINGDENGAVIEISEHHKLDLEYIVLLVKKSKHNEYSIIRNNAFRYQLPESEKNPRLKLLEMVLKALAAHTTDKKQSATKEKASATATTAKATSA